MFFEQRPHAAVIMPSVVLFIAGANLRWVIFLPGLMFLHIYNGQAFASLYSTGGRQVCAQKVSCEEEKGKEVPLPNSPNTFRLPQPGQSLHNLIFVPKSSSNKSSGSLEIFMCWMP